MTMDTDDDAFRTTIQILDLRPDDSHTMFWNKVNVAYGPCGSGGYPPIVWNVYFTLKTMDLICWDPEDPVEEEGETENQHWQNDFNKNFFIFTSPMKK